MPISQIVTNSIANSVSVTFTAGSAAAPAVTTTGDTNTGMFFPAADTIAFAEGGVEAMRLDSVGNVGIGTSSPGLSKLAISGSSITSYVGVTMTDTSTSKSYNIQSNNNSLTFADISTTYAERMRIDSSGNLLVGTTGVVAGVTGAGKGIELNTDGYIATKRNSTGFVGQISINNPNGQVGLISTTGSSTTYSTSSDYRLKENIAPMTGALATVQALKPVTYKWKIDGSDGQGFIAHELQEVVPDAVTGEKDAVNEDGSINPQGIDTSFLVATLTAAIQELKAELDTVKTELAALKG